MIIGLLKNNAYINYAALLDHFIATSIVDDISLQTFNQLPWTNIKYNAKVNTVHRLYIRVRLCSHHLSVHLQMQIPMKSIQVTVFE